MSSVPNSRPNPLIDLLISIVIPAVILMKFSGDQHLGAVWGLVIALAFPLVWGVIDLGRRRKVNAIAVLGLISVLLTGGIGLLELETKWLAVKEAAVPGVIGIAVLISLRTRYPLVKTLLYNPAILDVERVQHALDARGNRAVFDKRLETATYLLSATFFFSAVMNYVLATWIVTSPAGTEAFNAELGRLTLVSYPMIALPSMVMMVGILFFLVRAIRHLSGLSLEEVIKH